MCSFSSHVLVSLDNHRSAFTKSDSDNYILRVENESLSLQLQQLENERSYFVNQVANLSSDNLQLCSQHEPLTRTISQLRYDLSHSNKLRETLSDENQLLLREREAFSKNQIAASRELAASQKICNRLERDLRRSQEDFKILEASFSKEKSLLTRELDELRKVSDAEKNKFVLARMSLKSKVEELESKCKQFEESHVAIEKENKSLRSQRKKFSSRLKGTVGDSFDNHMDSLKNVQSSLIQHLIAEREGSRRFSCLCFRIELFYIVIPLSAFIPLIVLTFLIAASERSLKASLTTAETKLSQLKNKLTLLSTSRALSRERYERRIDYAEHVKEVCDRNNQRKVRRDTLLEAQVLMNEILLSHSLPPESLTSDDIGDDEVPRKEDADYYYESSGEDFDEDGNLVDGDGKVLLKADFADKTASQGDAVKEIVEENPAQQVVNEALLKDTGDANETEA